MEATIIGIKQLHQQLTEVTKAVNKGESFIVVKHSKPVFRITPLDGIRLEKKYTLKDFEKLQTNLGDPELSSKIDEIVYGV